MSFKLDCLDIIQVEIIACKLLLDLLNFLFRFNLELFGVCLFLWRQGLIHFYHLRVEWVAGGIQLLGLGVVVVWELLFSFSLPLLNQGVTLSLQSFLASLHGIRHIMLRMRLEIMVFNRIFRLLQGKRAFDSFALFSKDFLKAFTLIRVFSLSEKWSTVMVINHWNFLNIWLRNCLLDNRYFLFNSLDLLNILLWFQNFFRRILRFFRLSCAQGSKLSHFFLFTSLLVKVDSCFNLNQLFFLHYFLHQFLLLPLELILIHTNYF